MNKTELIESVRKTLGQECTRAHAERCVNAVMDSISEGLLSDQNVQLIGFGTFAVKQRKERMGRNPQTGLEMRIPASKTVGFRAGSHLKKTL